MLEAAQRETGLSGQKARDLLGGFLFSGADVEKPLADISGGEQRRLSLAILVASGANVLILDEPTNHLDIESREALEDALLEFEGAVLLVSHDRALLEAVGSRTLVCEDGGAAQPPRRLGRLPARPRRARGGAPRAASRPQRPRPRRRGSATGRPVEERAAARSAELEQRIERAEAELRALEDELADPAPWSSPGRAERATERHRAAKEAIERLYDEWQEAEASPVGSPPCSGSRRSGSGSGRRGDGCDRRGGTSRRRDGDRPADPGRGAVRHVPRHHGDEHGDRNGRRGRGNHRDRDPDGDHALRAGHGLVHDHRRQDR